MQRTYRTHVPHTVFLVYPVSRQTLIALAILTDVMIMELEQLHF